MAKVEITSNASGGGSVATGVLQLLGGVAMSATLVSVTDQSNTTSPLKLSTTLVQVVSTLKITTADDPYIDAEDNSGNNRFTIGRDPASQQVNLDFASNPTGSTTNVGAIRTYVDGVNLSEVMTFREDGNVGIGTTAPTSKFVVSDNTAGDPTILFEKDVINSFSDVNIYSKNASTNLTTGQLTGTVSFGGYFNSNYSPSSQDFAAIQSYYKGSGTTRLGQLQFRTHDGTGLQSAMTINESQLVGIGQTSPTARLHIVGKGSTTATTSLLVQNSAASSMFYVRDDGNIAIFTGRIFDGVNIEKSFYISSNDNVVSNYKAVSLRVFDGTAYASGLEVVGNGAESRVGIGTTAPNASAKLQADSTTKGFLPPRMTTAQKNAIATPAAGLMVYDTTLNKLCVRTAAAWETITSI